MKIEECVKHLSNLLHNEECIGAGFNEERERFTSLATRAVDDLHALYISKFGCCAPIYVYAPVFQEYNVPLPL